MAIIQTVIKGSGGEPYVPSYVPPKDNVSGVYKNPNTATSFNLNGATDVDSYALYSAFQFCTNLTSIDLSSLTTVSGSNAMQYCFNGCTGLTGVLDLSLLTTISGSQAMGTCFQNCTNLTSVDLSSLTTIGASGMNSCFMGCTGLTSIDLSSLTTLSGNSALNRCFVDCSSLTSIDLSSLTTVSGSNAMQYCFNGCTGLTTVRIGGTTAIDFGTQKGQFNLMFNACNQASGIDLYIATDQATLSTMTGYDSSGNNHHFGATCEVRIHYTAQ